VSSQAPSVIWLSPGELLPLNILDPDRKHFIFSILEVSLPAAGYQSQPLNGLPPLRLTVKPNGQPDPGGSIFRCTSTISRMTGLTSSPWLSLHTTNTSHSANMVTPFFANKVFTQTQKCPRICCVRHCSLSCYRYQRLHQYLHNQMSHALKQYKVHSAT